MQNESKPAFGDGLRRSVEELALDEGGIVVIQGPPEKFAFSATFLQVPRSFGQCP